MNLREFTVPDITSGILQGTVHGPTLFLVFINDIADNLHSTARLFADDCVIYRPIHREKDHQLMQEDLDTLVGWSDTSVANGIQCFQMCNNANDKQRIKDRFPL